MPQVLPTGCKAIDNLLGGGIHYGMVTDIYGESGTGKTQLCFTICARSAEYFETSQKVSIVFVDTGGTFRPERITEIAGITKMKTHILDKILVVRPLSSTDQINSINRLSKINPRLLIIDGVASLFTTDYRGAARHFSSDETSSRVVGGSYQSSLRRSNDKYGSYCDYCWKPSKKFRNDRKSRQVKEAPI